MVNQSRRRLNQRLRQNWVELNRKLEATGGNATPSNVDDCDLKSLSWLIDLDMDCLASPCHPSFKRGLAGQPPTKNGLVDAADMAQQDGGCKARFRKPTHTYSAMITMAINETPDKQITVAGIYNWIRNNFFYYRNTSASWKNSVRHCLSTNRRFQRMPQTRDKFGKRFWRIVPDTLSGATTSPGGSVPRRHPRHLLAKTSRTTPSDDCNISEAIRCIGRWETIGSTGESQGNDSTADSIDESSVDSLAADSFRTDLSSPQPPSSGLFDSDCDTRLNEILRDLSDLESNQTATLGYEPNSFGQTSGFSYRQRLPSLESDCLLTTLNTATSGGLAEDWSLADLSHLSSCKPNSDFLPNSCLDDLSSYLLDADLSLKMMI